jgi:uncharacterized membrane protein
MNNLQFYGRLFVFFWFFVSGVMHFARADLFLSIVPPYIPYALAAVYISGAFELLGAIGIWRKEIRHFVGYGLMILTVAVTPANIYMLQHADLFSDIPVWFLVARLPFQLLLIWLIWRCSRSE